jgi:hypothetical protein
VRTPGYVFENVKPIPQGGELVPLREARRRWARDSGARSSVKQYDRYPRSDHGAAETSPEAFKVGEILGKVFDSVKYGQEEVLTDHLLPPAGTIIPPLV